MTFVTTAMIKVIGLEDAKIEKSTRRKKRWKQQTLLKMTLVTPKHFHHHC
jgi:hypothetical protein